MRQPISPGTSRRNVCTVSAELNSAAAAPTLVNVVSTNLSALAVAVLEDDGAHTTLSLAFTLLELIIL